LVDADNNGSFGSAGDFAVVSDDLNRTTLFGPQIATAQTNASQFTTPFDAQTYQVRVISTLPIWAIIGSSAVVTAHSISRGKCGGIFRSHIRTCLNFISTSTSTGYVTVCLVGSAYAKLLPFMDFFILNLFYSKFIVPPPVLRYVLHALLGHPP